MALSFGLSVYLFLSTVAGRWAQGYTYAIPVLRNLTLRDYQKFKAILVYTKFQSSSITQKDLIK